MNLSEIINKSVNLISKKPIILVPPLIPAILSVITSIAGMAWAISSADYWTQFQYMRWETMQPEQMAEVWRQILTPLVPVIGVAMLVGIIIWIIAVIAFSMVITMTQATLDGKDMTLSQAFSSISGEILLLIVASLVVLILRVLGLCAICIGALIVWVFLALVRQGIVVDHLGFGGSFSRSYNIGKSHFFDIFLILLLFLVVKLLIRIIPIVGNALGYIVDAFSVCALTILYIDRKGT